MAPSRSAGLLLYRETDSVDVLLAHMGGPLWTRKDERAWTLPKGEYGDDEEPLVAAKREFAEELGLPAPDGPLLDLGSVRQSGGKVVVAWAIAADLEPDAITPGTFTMEWPPRSGTMRQFPEIDRVAWFDLPTARQKVIASQTAFLDRLAAQLG